MKKPDKNSLKRLCPVKCRQSDVIRTFDWKKLKEKLTIFSHATPKASGVCIYGSV